MGTHHYSEIKSRTSFLPLVRKWEQIVQTGREATRSRAQRWLQEISIIPELMRPIESEEVLKTHQSTIERILSGLFPVTLSDEQDIYAVLQPFNQQVLYASSLFRQIFMNGNNEFVQAPEPIADDLDQDKICGAYQLILNQVYHVQVEGEVSSVHHFLCPETHLDKYMELTLDPRFIDVVPEADIPQLPLNNLKELNVYDILKNETLLNPTPT